MRNLSIILRTKKAVSVVVVVVVYLLLLLLFYYNSLSGARSGGGVGGVANLTLCWIVVLSLEIDDDCVIACFFFLGDEEFADQNKLHSSYILREEERCMREAEASDPK